MGYNDNFKEQITAAVDSLTAAEKMKFSELIFKKNVEVSDISKSHQVQTGVRSGHLIPIIDNKPNYESFPFVDEKDCKPTECELDAKYSTKKWELGLLECRVPICMRKFDEDFLLFWNMYRQTTSDLDLNSAFIDYLSSKFQSNLLAAQWRVVYFGDKSSHSTFFNKIDGFFTQAQANPNQIVPISENKAGTYAEQRLAGKRVYEILEQMYTKASEQIWFDPTACLYKMTKSNGLAFISWLNSLGNNSPYNCECIDPHSVVKSNVFTLENVRYNGIPITIHQEFDGVINQTSELNGTGANNPRVNPNRIILTYKSNLRIGTSESKALNSFDIFYDKRDKMIYMDGGSYIGSSLVLDSDYILAI